MCECGKYNNPALSQISYSLPVVVKGTIVGYINHTPQGCYEPKKIKKQR